MLFRSLMFVVFSFLSQISFAQESPAISAATERAESFQPDLSDKEIWNQSLLDRSERINQYFAGVPKEMDQFAFFLGSWDTKQTLFDLDGNILNEGVGLWVAETVGDGRMIADKYLATLPNGAAIHGGITLRAFNVQTNQWDMTYLGTVEAMSLLKLGGHLEDDEIRATGQAVDLQGNKSLQQIRFFDISKNSFEWELQISWDDGETWYRVATTSAERKAETMVDN